MEFNQKGIEAAVDDIRNFVQANKVDFSRRTINKLIQNGQFSEEYRSYVGTITDRNAFDDPDKFYRVMLATPKAFNRPFTFYSTGFFNRERLLEAVLFAIRTIDVQTSRFIGATRAGLPLSGAYRAGHVITKLEDNVRTLLASPDQILREDGAFIIQLWNAVDYAATVEKNAVYFARIGGIYFFAAEQLKQRFPDLSIRFTYYQPANIETSHTQATPVLTIGDRRFVRDKIRRPGRNHLRRRRNARRNT